MTIENSAEIIHKLKKFASTANSYNQKQNNRIKSDLEFAGGKQYLDSVDRNVRGEGRAELVFNLTRQYCNQLINQYRKKPYGITVSPRKPDAATKASQAQAIIRGWESTSGMPQEVVTAVDRQVKCGIGYVVLSNDYASMEGWDQDIKIQAILRPDMVVYDPFSKTVDGVDATQCAFVEHVSEEVAEEMFGGESHEDFENMDSPLDGTNWMCPDESVSVITYFVMKKTKAKIYQDAQGNTISGDKVRKNSTMKSRDTMKSTVCVYKIVGNQVLSETELNLSRLPIIPFRGELIDIDGKIDWVGIVNFAKDPARLINWTASITAERMAIAPKTTRFVDMKSIAHYTDIWQKSNRLNVPYLPFDSRDNEGNTYTPPVSDNPSVDIAGPSAAQASYQAIMSSILGMPEAGSLVSGSPNQTASEVLTRAKNTEVSNFQYMDNAAKSVKAIGKVFIEMMSIIYDTERLLPTLVDGDQSIESVNVAELNIMPSEMEVAVDAGPMMDTQRHEAFQSLLALGSMLGPDATLVFASDILANADFDNADVVAAKLDAYAKLKTGIGAAPSTQQDPEAVAALQQAQNAVTQLQQTAQQNTLYIQQLQAELSSRNLDLQVAREKMQWDYKRAVDIEAMKQQGASSLQTQKSIEQAELEAQKASNEVDKTMAQPPVINVVTGIPADRNAIGGQRNDLFAQ
jgi:hypothetical protein